MHPYVMQEIARQRQEDLRRAARQYGPAGPRSHRPVTLDLAAWARELADLFDHAASIGPPGSGRGETT